MYIFTYTNVYTYIYTVVEIYIHIYIQGMYMHTYRIVGECMCCGLRGGRGTRNRMCDFVQLAGCNKFAHPNWQNMFVYIYIYILFFMYIYTYM